MAKKWIEVMDRFFHALSFIFTLCIFLAIAGILGSLSLGGLESIKTFGFQFFSSTTWSPSLKSFGAIVPVVGTLITATLALFIAVPISFGIAYFINELAQTHLKVPLTLLIELLAIIPSIIYGMWGLFVFAPKFGLNLAVWLSENLGNKEIIGLFFKGASHGINMLTAGIVLAIMIIPFIAVSFKDAYELVPSTLKESAYAVGCTRWEVIWNVSTPYIKTQIIGSMMLGLGRALGETMAVAFVIGNAYSVTTSIVKPSTTIAASIANEFAEAEDSLYTSSLMAIALILFLISCVVLIISRLFLQQLKRKEGEIQ